MEISSSYSSTSSIYNMDEKDSNLSASIISEKDTDASGDVSASELGVSASDIAEFDTDGDGVLSSAELAAALKSKREKMQAQMSSQMEQSSQLGMLQSTLSGASTEEASAEEAPSTDQLIASLFGDDAESATSAVSASTAAATETSNSGSTLSEYLEQMDAEMAETILSMKDTNGDGELSAEELGATAEQVAELDVDGNGVLNESELTDGLRAEREAMMAENGGMMPPPPPTEEGSSTVSGTSSASMDSVDMDTLMQSMFSSSTGTSTSDSTSSASASATTLSEFLLRQKASNAYQSVDSLVAGLFSSSMASQSVSLDA